jgi:hypothetical protein
MHGFILLLSSVAHWRKDQSISDEILTRLDKIESLLEGFPNREETLKSLIEDGKMLKEMPSRWARERRETMALLSFIRTVLIFQVRKYPESKSEFNNYIKENVEYSP